MWQHVAVSICLKCTETGIMHALDVTTPLVGMHAWQANTSIIGGCLRQTASLACLGDKVHQIFSRKTCMYEEHAALHKEYAVLRS